MRSFLVVLVLAGLQLSPLASQAASTAPLQASVTITVAGLDNPLITARYSLSRPVHQISFQRKASGLREKTWDLVTAGLKIRKSNIYAKNGKDFRHFTVTLKLVPGIIDFNYQPEIVIRNHGVAVFTGYFNIAGTQSQTVFHFRSRHYQVLAYGALVSSTKTVSPPGNGTFVYFGNLKPVRNPYSTMIVDPQLPGWASTLIKAEVPAVVSYYTKQYSIRLPKRPFLLFSWKDRHRVGDSSEKGDSLPGTIGFTLLGEGWKAATKRNRGELAKLLAHELAHQWNEHLFTPTGLKKSGASWLGEGQAEYAATVVAEHFGWFSPSAALHHFTALVNDCLQASTQRPIAKQRHSFRAVYGCGVTFNLLAQGVLAKHSPPRTFFDFWKAIYAKATKRQHKYSIKTYVYELGKLSGNWRIPKMVTTLVSKSARYKNIDILGALRHLKFGLAPVTSEDHNPVLGRLAAEGLFTQIMKSDCEGKASYDIDSSGFTVQPMPRCQVLDRPYTITAIDGHKLFSEGIGAYRKVKSECRGGGKIRLEIKHLNNVLTVNCPKKLSPMPTMVDITSLPWKSSHYSRPHPYSMQNSQQ